MTNRQFTCWGWLIFLSTRMTADTLSLLFNTTSEWRTWSRVRTATICSAWVSSCVRRAKQTVPIFTISTFLRTTDKIGNLWGSGSLRLSGMSRKIRHKFTKICSLSYNSPVIGFWFLDLFILQIPLVIGISLIKKNAKFKWSILMISSSPLILWFKMPFSITEPNTIFSHCYKNKTTWNFTSAVYFMEKTATISSQLK